MPDNVKVVVKLSSPENGYVIRNLYALYLHDLSAFNGAQPNVHGVLEEDRAVRDLAQQTALYGSWWRDAQSLFPYLIEVNGLPAGFALVDTHPHVDAEVNWELVEFFVAHAYRGTGIAGQAAEDVFARHPGRWELGVLADNHRAQAFWHKTLLRYSDVTEERYKAGTLNIMGFLFRVTS